ncbi:tyrosine-type recombinase/integrase [Polaribacter haliotis]|uniref:Tyrosine-type recombinase/integrase n=1 Tax=Polaribacter haliotis TaxID=1888915 RepID=A0A7L8AFC4_9FLAO|nr:tyrosine-type recombinase/integrase [Polaribacter haliotis]QOD60644.1 tyrosine-type recombinase/integrase [Polaribacter haliotis]
MKSVEIYKQKLTNKNYSKRTIETYVCYLEKFLQEIKKNPYHITTKEIENYLLNKNYSSISVQNQVIGSLKLFAKYILGKKEVHLNKIERPKREKKLPRIIDAELLAERISMVKNLKHKAILTLGLSCGLRISEVINLKWLDLDKKRNVLNVINGKGKKDRITFLNNNLIELLTEYWLEYRSEEYVFNGQFKNQYSATSIQRLVKKYIHPTASFHLLRHSFATYALDNGTGIGALADIMGHNSIKTTEIYYHTSLKAVQNLKQVI